MHTRARSLLTARILWTNTMTRSFDAETQPLTKDATAHCTKLGRSLGTPGWDCCVTSNCTHDTAPRALHTRSVFCVYLDLSFVILVGHASCAVIVDRLPAFSCRTTRCQSTRTFEQCWTLRFTDRRTVWSIGRTMSSHRLWAQRHCRGEQYRGYTYAHTIKETELLFGFEFWWCHNYACVFGSRWETKAWECWLRRFFCSREKQGQSQQQFITLTEKDLCLDHLAFRAQESLWWSTHTNGNQAETPKAYWSPGLWEQEYSPSINKSGIT